MRMQGFDWGVNWLLLAGLYPLFPRMDEQS